MGLRNTEVPGLFIFHVGGAKLDTYNLDEITSSDDAVRAFLRTQTSNRDDIKFGELICYSQYRYVIYVLGTFFFFFRN